MAVPAALGHKLHPIERPHPGAMSIGLLMPHKVSSSTLTLYVAEFNSATIPDAAPHANVVGVFGKHTRRFHRNHPP
jgi:hypothetical protein